MSALTELLQRLPVASPFPFALNARRCLKLDLSGGNPSLREINAGDTASFGAWIAEQIARAGADYAAGGYGEDRTLYEMSPHFRADGAQTRTLHLGIDLWVHEGTPVHAIHDGRVHSTADNHAFGDYGPTIVLEHRVEGQLFHTLYGHLSRPSLERMRAGDLVRAGEHIGWLGAAHENVGWPPHLHFQLIRDMEGRRGDYPGVCLRADAQIWLRRCPDPNLILRIKALAAAGERPF